MDRHAQESPIAEYETWQLGWRDGQWSTPDGVWHHGLAGERPDIAVAHEAIDAWAEATNITAHLPRAGGYSVWWTLRFCLVHEYLGGLLPHLRALQHAASAKPFRASRLAIPPDAPEWWRLLPRCMGLVEHVDQPPTKRDLKRISARIFKGVIGEWRLQRRLFANSDCSRILAVSRANAWNGVVDRELSTVLEALEQAGHEPLIIEQSHGPLAAQLHGWRTRPSGHLLGDFVHLRQLFATKPAATTPPVLAKTPLMLEGLDVAPIVRDFIERMASAHAYQHGTYVNVLPEILRKLKVRAVLLTDENGAEHGLKIAALQAGIPVVAVQHGCIHADHMSYIFPAMARDEEVPLASKTCVYGSHEAELLTQDSIYGEGDVVVTGQVANDTRCQGMRAWGQRGAAGEKLRAAVLPAGCDRLLLLTSQDLLHYLAAERLLPRLRASPARYFLAVRTHPREDASHWENYFTAFGVANRARLSTSGSLDDWLDACDAHISVSSTALSEAVVWGRPNILLGRDVAGDWLSVLPGGMAYSLEESAGLDDVVQEWMQRTQEDIQRQRTAYLQNHFHLLDGNAGKRISNVLCDYLS